MYWSYFWEFVKRNILTIVIMAVVAAAFPWTLVFMIPVAIVVIRLQMAMWKVRRNFQNSYQEQQQQQGGGRRAKAKEEGKVTVVRTEQTQQRVSDDVGEYVDFKEIKEEETK
jgi:membrane protein implicated in regulation of membrane protease activity